MDPIIIIIIGMINKDYYLHHISPDIAQKIHTDLSRTGGGTITEIDTSRYYLVQATPVSNRVFLGAMESYFVGQAAFGMACVVFFFIGFCIHYKDTKYQRDHEAWNNSRLQKYEKEQNLKRMKRPTP